MTHGAVLASHTVVRPVRDALVLDGNPDQIPWLFTATFLAMLVVSPAWSAALHDARVQRRRRLVPVTFRVFALCAIGFAFAVALELAPITVGRVLYVCRRCATCSSSRCCGAGSPTCSGPSARSGCSARSRRAARFVKVIEDRTVGVYNALGPAKRLTMREMLDACNAAAGDKRS